MSDELIAQAELGEEARKFLESDLGKVLLGLAQQQVDAALDDLGKVSPTDVEKIRDLQSQVKVGRWFGQWLKELLSDGENAIQTYQQQRDTN